MNVDMHKTKMVELGKLMPADYNPREMSDEAMQALMNSLKEFGFVEPVVARAEDGLVIGGHQRLSAMRNLLVEEQGMGEDAVDKVKVPVVYLDGVTDDKAKVLNVALNKIHGDWDYDKLRDVFESIDFDTIDVTLSGFEMPEIGELGVLLGGDGTGGSANGDFGGIDPDAVLDAERRKFQFQVGSDEQADTCREALRAYGMTGPKNASSAFAAAMRAALETHQAIEGEDSEST